MKKLSTNQVFKAIFCVALALLIICGLTVSGYLSNHGAYKVKEVKIQMDGYDLQGTLFIPKVALTKDGTLSSHSTGENVCKVPALVTQGGGSANRYIQYPHIIEFVKRGFAVFAIDAYTHGCSEDFNEGWGVYSQVHDALQYLHSLSFVDDAHVGYMGHSQGGSATMLALKEYAGFYTLQDKLLNMLYEELGAEITAEDVAAQDADAVAAKLDEFSKGYYESRKAEIIDEYDENRVSFGIMLGMAPGAAPPLSTREFNNVVPEVVEVGGIPVMRNIQANIGIQVSFSDESMGMNALSSMQMSSTKELATTPSMRLFFGTGDETVQLETLYAANMPTTEETVPSTVIGKFGAESLSDAAVLQAGEDLTLRMLTMFTGWHNTNHFCQKDIQNAVNFAVLATGYNNGYIAETNGAGGAAFDDCSSWKVAYAFTWIAFIALIVLALSFAAILFGKETFKEAVCDPIAPQASKKSAVAWIFTAIVVILPVVLITPLMNHSIFKASWVAKFDRICPIAYWSLCCAAILLVLILIKWYKIDKKNTELSFREFYGITGNFKSIMLIFFGAFIAWALFMTTVNVYYKLFNSANFTVALPKLNMTVEFTPISTERYIDYFFYFLYFLPYWVVGGMLVNSARMKDMPEWLNTVIITLANLIPIAIFVYVSYAGNIVTGGTKTVLGLNWATLIQMQGLTIAIPIGVVISRVLYKRTGSVLPGALLNSAIFTLPFMCTVVAYTVSSMPVR